MDRKAWIVLTLCTLGMLWYMFDYSPKVQRQQREYREAQEEKLKRAQEEKAAKEKKEGTPGKVDPDKPDDPDKPVVPEVPEAPEVKPENPILESKNAEGETVAVFTFTNIGAGIELVELKEHFTSYDSAKPIVLNQYAEHPIGALSPGIGEVDSHVYQVVRKSESEIEFQTTTDDKLKITKTFSLEDPSEPGAPYRVNLEMTFENVDESRRYPLVDYYLYAGAIAALKPKEFMQPDYTSVLFKNGSKYRNRDVNYFKKKEERINYNPDAEELLWGGPMNQYFVHNICAEQPYPAKIWAQRFAQQLDGYSKDQSDGQFAVHAGIGMPKLSIEPGQSETQSYQFYIGPKTLKELKEMGRDRVKIMRYNIIPILGGVAAPVSKFLMGMLLWLQDIVHNYGVAILIMTVLLRTAMWPVYAKSQKTMKRMAKLSPKMTELREKYKDNPQKMQQETAKLFRENGMGPMGPLGGCLPMLIQIPVFLGFFQMLRLAVELRHEPFTLWVGDLSMPDTLFTVPGIGLPFNVLPILMAVTMIWQMKITPKSGDAMQQKLMMIMPVIFLVFCYNFASALALYWTGQNIFSIGQTYLTRNKDVSEPSKEPEISPQEIAKKRAAKGSVRTGGARAKKKKKK